MSAFRRIALDDMPPWAIITIVIIFILMVTFLYDG